MSCIAPLHEIGAPKHRQPQRLLKRNKLVRSFVAPRHSISAPSSLVAAGAPADGSG
jgi:hypothetical protein